MHTSLESRYRDVHVFVGPSCHESLASRVLTAQYHPPAKRGDLQRVHAAGASVIVLIDGCIVHGYPPSPMEIGAILNAGVRVFGAASLGALRAVELRGMGMIGSGWVFQQYVSRRIDADDEVVVLFDPATSSPRTIPLVQIRFACQAMVSAGLISERQSSRLVSGLATLCFDERTPETVCRIAGHEGISEDVQKRILGVEFAIKQHDTIKCLEEVKQWIQSRRHAHEGSRTI
jgi:TfuA protein